MEEENLDIYFMNLSEGSTIQRVTNTDEEKLFFVRYEPFSLCDSNGRYYI